MSVDISEGIESGKVTIKVLTTNTASITVLTEEKFGGKVIQPEANANRALGEHGLSMSIKIEDDGESHLFLLDTGSLSQAIIENSKQFGINLNEVEKLIISHGHFDHWGGLTAVIPLLKEGTEIIINPRCFEQNYAAVSKNGEEISAEELSTNLKQLEKEGKLRMSRKLPLLNKNMVINLVDQHKLKLIEINTPIKLYKGITTSGEIELFDEDEVTKSLYIQKGRKEFEKHYFRDETAVYINIKDKGLVILTGCGHCGIINTIKHAQKLTGIDKIYAVIGGFHEEWNPINKIEKKVKYFEQLNPEIICGMHCTGFEFNKQMSNHPSHTLGVSGTEFHP
ncbi:MAG: MBL fold metallo-hydrolase [Promethearchaeota archaeon]|nr:MAG: MBL fold metallo-hydrolase [Candidatus Lokiarchaeota archaeon]